MKLVSIIVPCYNQGKYLKMSLDSILNQSYPDWECIVINDGSNDDTEKIALGYLNRDERFKYKFQQNKGLSAARNLGISIAKGDFIQLLDADDLIEPDKLAIALAQYHHLENHKRLIIYSSMRYFESEEPAKLKVLGRNDFIGHVELKLEDSPASQKELVQFRNPFVISAPLYPADLFKEIGSFDASLTALEDWDLHIRCLKSGYLFHHHAEAGTRTLIRLHDKSMMRNQHLMDTNFGIVNTKHQLKPMVAPEVKHSVLTGFFKKIKNRLKP
ncbi:glycosyltransferase family A protein [Pedobacter frigidisoli]|uniref:glycosyltransferase family 2 protein n=1 Tax=Pedobacter frigidisoli TaxID=2530455 RepID=UPI00292E69D6|nr:glycosyltransferase family A protein [Pedobacter frigidisoli]